MRDNTGDWGLRSVKEEQHCEPRKMEEGNFSVHLKQAHQQSQTVPQSIAVLVDETLPVQRHQESGRLDPEECVVSRSWGLFASDGQHTDAIW